MRKILIISVAGAALAVAPALAAKPATKPAHPAHPAKCKINSVGYNAKGTLDVAPTLTQTQGVGTPTTSDDRYSGTLIVTVKKANHKAPTGAGQTFTLTDAKVGFDDANHDGTADTPAVGDTVRLHGKITKYKKKCTQDTPVISVKRVSFKTAAPTI
jgi:hypothetical protein